MEWREMGKRDPGRTRMSPTGSKWVRQPGKCWLALRQKKKVACFGLQRGTCTPRVSAVPLNLRSSSRPGDAAVSGSGWQQAALPTWGEGGKWIRAGNPVWPRQRMSGHLVSSLSLSLSFVSSLGCFECGVTAGTHAPSTTYRVCGDAQNSLQVGIVNAFECCLGSWL